jgi:hypothetical protein
MAETEAIAVAKTVEVAGVETEAGAGPEKFVSSIVHRLISLPAVVAAFVKSLKGVNLNNPGWLKASALNKPGVN